MHQEQPDLAKQISLCDALDRMLNRGVVLSGDIVVSVAGVDLLYIGLRGLICSMDALDSRPASLDSTRNRPIYDDASWLTPQRNAS